MKKILSKLLTILVFISMILPSSSIAFAAKLSNPPVETNITITNNAGVPDILNVTSLAKGDIVYVYSSSTGKKSIGTGTANVAGIVKISIKQLGTAAGNVYVAVKSTGLLESNKIKKAYDAEAKSTPLDPTGIVVTNNAFGTKDTVVVPGLVIGDIVKVYSSATGGVALGTAKATKTGEVTVSIPQIGASVGSLYISVTSNTLLESDRTAVAYLAEAKSTPLDPTGIVVTNNAVGTADTVLVQNLAKGDIINVYSTRTAGVLLGTSTAKADGNLTVSIPQIGASVGSLYISVTSNTLLESDRTAAVAYLAEAKSTTLDPTTIVVTNNAVGTADTVVVQNLAIGDIINVYSTPTAGVLLGTSTAKIAGNLTVSIPQIGEASGDVYVTVTSKTLLESDRTTAVAYDAEAKSIPLDVAHIVVTNNAVGTADTVAVQNLAIGDIVNVYSTSIAGVSLGTATAKIAGDLTVSIPQIGADSGRVYVTVTSKTLLESDRTIAIAYTAEAKSTPLDPNDIVVTNNAVGTNDTVVVRNLDIGDIVKVYSAAKNGVVIGTSTATASGLTVSIKQIGAASGNVYVSVIRKTFLESYRTLAVPYAAEAKSASLYPSDIVVTNNAAGTADTVVVKNLAIGDIVKIYSSATTGIVIGTATATVVGDLTVSILQIGATGGNIYVSVTSKSFLESPRTSAIPYAAEAKSLQLDPSNIIVINNAVGTVGRVLVQNVAIGDIIKVYSSVKGGVVIGTATALVRGDIFVSITQTGAASKNIYVSVTTKKLLESDRTVATKYF